MTDEEDNTADDNTTDDTADEEDNTDDIARVWDLPERLELNLLKVSP